MLQSGSPVRGKAAWPWWCRPLKVLGGGVSVPETMTASRAQCQAPRRSKQAMALGRGCRLVKSAYWAVTTTRSGGGRGVHGLLCQPFPWGLGKQPCFKKKCSQESRPQDGVPKESDQAEVALSPCPGMVQKVQLCHRGPSGVLLALSHIEPPTMLPLTKQRRGDPLSAPRLADRDLKAQPSDRHSLP